MYLIFKAYRTFTDIHHMLTRLNEFQYIEIIQNLIPDHTGVKADIDNKKNILF